MCVYKSGEWWPFWRATKLKKKDSKEEEKVLLRFLPSFS